MQTLAFQLSSSFDHDIFEKTHMQTLPSQHSSSFDQGMVVERENGRSEKTLMQTFASHSQLSLPARGERLYFMRITFVL